MRLCKKCGTENTTNSKFCKGCGYELPQIERIEETLAKKEPTKKFNLKALLGAIFGVVIIIVISQGVSFAAKYFITTTPMMDNMLIKTAEEINKSCPILIDEMTRLDNVSALPGKKIQYNYTILGIDREQADTVTFKANMEPLLLNNIRTNPDMKFLRENNTTFSYYCKDETGAYWFRILITPKHYKE